ncbi:hypothetical protein JQC67_09010 [Aurantibacter crassamenti]|uniref:hypothetical protein n=1 Tax=Aurantibacter crassamenti TaxID=1837375 RepID=UPI001939A053|nr:hypothetical protein [Aurantibacter crassamenti]MBM1106273.1 hypothetical protein [Aurantibacter crassamenti]
MRHTKRLFSSLSLVVLIGFTLYNCKNEKGQTPEVKDNQKDSITKQPDEIIDINIAREHYLTYENRRVNLIQKYEDSINRSDKRWINQNIQQDANDPNGKGFDVARYVYWDYKTIKNYLNYIEKEAAEANVEISTLRFYFSNNKADEKSAIHPRQNSIMISPTLKANNRDFIFAIDDSNLKSIKPQLLTDDFELIFGNNESNGNTNLYENSKAHASFLPNTSTANNNTIPNAMFVAKSLTLNKGNSAPPPHH